MASDTILARRASERESAPTPSRRPTARRRGRGARLLASVGVVLALGLVVSSCTSPDEDTAFALVNQSRHDGFRAPLSGNITMHLVAQSWSKHMSDAGRLSHRPNLAAGMPGGWRKLGENVGTGPSVQAIHNAFLSSGPHVANMVDMAFNNLGVGVTVDGRGQRWEVQIYAAL